MKPRTLLAGALVILGVVLTMLAPDTLSGLVVLGLGIGVELAGLGLEKKKRGGN